MQKTTQRKHGVSILITNETEFMIKEYFLNRHFMRIRVDAKGIYNIYMHTCAHAHTRTRAHTYTPLNELFRGNRRFIVVGELNTCSNK